MPYPNNKHTQRRNSRQTKGATGLLRRLTTNYSFNAAPYLGQQAPGLMGAIRYAIKDILLSVGVPLLYTIILIVAYMIWIPFLIYALIWFLQQ